MVIDVKNRKLKAALEDDSICLKRFGKVMARFVRLRMDALNAAQSLHDFWPPKSKPERVHELTGKQKGVFSTDLQQPYRLLFVPSDDQQRSFNDEQERWRSIRHIEILSIEDTHG